MPVEKPFIVATAGHIDHGKSTLVEALSGTNPDRLPEERKRGMTIELGFASLDIADPQDKGTVFHLGLIDVPGHSDFVKNMVAGVGSIDLALLVVAGDDGWMPQTEEHFQILLYLGVRRAVVALTKSDVIEDRELAIADIRDHLAGTPLAEAVIVPVCAISEEGLPELKSAIAEALRDAPPPADIGKPRLFVDRVFSPKGAGTVVTGTLSGGRLKTGQELIVQPRGLATRVRGLQNHNRTVDEALPGMRTAVQLHDVAVATEEHPEGVHRGDAITNTTMGQPSLTLDVWLEKSERDIPGNPGATLPVKTGQKVRLHLGSGSHDARVYFTGTRQLAAGEHAAAELRFSSPVFALGGDRFVLRDWSKRSTIAGGIVLDPQANRRRFRREAQQIFLQERASAPEDAGAWIRTVLARDHALPAAGLLAQTRFADAAVRGALDTLEDVKRIGSLIVEARAWQNSYEAATRAIGDFHQRHPEALGMKLGDLRALVEPLLADKKLFEPLLEHLLGHGFVRAAGNIRATTHVPRLPAELQSAGTRIRAALSAQPMEPPNPKEMAPTPLEQKALKFLLDTGEAVFLDDKAVILATALDEAKNRIAGHIHAKGRATVSDLREVVGTTRRILVPLLERLDKDGFTRREGDFRTLRH